MKIFTAAQMREFDRVAVEEYKIPSIVLMENAALRVVEFLEMKFAPLEDKRIAVLCGKGNNGGDGFAIARHLCENTFQPTVLLACSPNDLKGDALTNFTALEAAAKSVVVSAAIHYISGDEMPHQFGNYDLIIDALLGTGFKGEVKDNRLQAALQFLRASSLPIVAVDIPSGLNADTGEIAPESAYADYTVTFAFPKRGLFLRDGVNACGEIWVGAIGTMSVNEFMAGQTGCECLTHFDSSYRIPHRSLDAHKGSAGRAVIIGGSFGMSGAPTLAARAVLRAGAGLCIACLPDKVLSTFAIGCPEATSKPLPCDEEGRLIPEAANGLPEIWKGAQVVAIGPGISRSQRTLEFVRRVVRECPLPIVVDADALYALREIESDVKARTAPTILTPHPGEMGELMQIETSAVNDNRFETAIACAEKYGAIVVLKGARSIVAIPDFQTCRKQITGATFVNLTGNPGMATGGSGDVLTGTIAGLLAQTRDAQSATLLGVYTHGLAGDLYFETRGNGLIAGDIADALSQALLEIAKPLEAPPNARLRKLQ